MPPDMIDVINAEPALDFQKFIREDMLSDLKTFETMRSPPPGMFEELVMKGLTRALREYLILFPRAMADELTHWCQRNLRSRSRSR